MPLNKQFDDRVCNLANVNARLWIIISIAEKPQGADRRPGVAQPSLQRERSTRLFESL